MAAIQQSWFSWALTLEHAANITLVNDKFIHWHIYAQINLTAMYDGVHC